MKVTGAVILILALAMGILSQFTDCLSQGRLLMLKDGKTTVPMKCHWTGLAEAAVATPLGLVGVSAAFSKRKETHRALAMLGVVLGAVAISLPTWLIGVCSNPMMLCNSVMKPALILGGILVIGVSIVDFVITERKLEKVG